MRDTRDGCQQCGSISWAYLRYRAVAVARYGPYGGSYRGIKLGSQTIAKRLRFAHGVSSDVTMHEAACGYRRGEDGLVVSSYGDLLPEARLVSTARVSQFAPSTPTTTAIGCRFA